MNNTEKMVPVLNLAKRVRFQRTNQARIAPFYDASLYVFSPKDAVDATGKTFPKNAKTIHAQFSALHAPLFAEIYIFFYGCCTFISYLNNHPEVVIGKSTGKQKTIQARKFSPQAPFHIFFDKTNRAGIRTTKDKLEVNYVWDLCFWLLVLI